MRNKRTEQTSPASKPLYDFATLTWKGAPLDGLKEHLMNNISLISSYPEREGEVVARLLSRRLDVDSEEILLTHGASAAYRLLARAFSGSRSMVFPPMHKEVHRYLEEATHTVIPVSDVKDITKLSLEGVEVVWLQLPNSPDGRVHPRRKLLSLFREHPEIIFIVDIAMASYLIEDTIKANDLNKYSNLILLSSFSSAYNIPGLRLGYVVAKREILSKLLPYYTQRSISTLALSAAHFILVHPAVFTVPVRKWLRESVELAALLSKIEGVTPLPSSAPFFIVEFNEECAEELATFLLEKHNILVRVASNGTDLKPNQIRVTPHAKYDTNILLVEAISNFFEQKAQ